MTTESYPRPAIADRVRALPLAAPRSSVPITCRRISGPVPIAAAVTVPGVRGAISNGCGILIVRRWCISVDYMFALRARECTVSVEHDRHVERCSACVYGARAKRCRIWIGAERAVRAFGGSNPDSGMKDLSRGGRMPHSQASAYRTLHQRARPRRQHSPSASEKRHAGALHGANTSSVSHPLRSSMPRTRTRRFPPLSWTTLH